MDHQKLGNYLAKRTVMLKEIGEGNTRKVYTFGKYVLKVDKGCRGQRANEEEYEKYNEIANSAVEKYFVKVFAVAQDGSWLLAERVDNCFGDNYGEYSKIIEEEDMEEFDIPHELVDLMNDDCLFNIGRRFNTNEYVILDYQ